MRWRAFLDNMQEHIDKLPDKQELKELRESAQKFVKDVRDERGVGGDGGGRVGLGRVRPHPRPQEGQGGRRHPQEVHQGLQRHGQLRRQGAEVSAELCKATGQYARPTAGRHGHGQRHGRRQRNGWLRTDGPLRRTARDASEIPARPPAAAKATRGEKAARRSNANPDEAKPDELFAPGAAAGASEGAVPVRYRRQVDEYFQRVAEETGESGR